MKLLLAILCTATALFCSTPAAHAQLGREKGEAFLAENAKKEGVKTLPSGLQYRVLKAGDGKHPAKSDQVVVHYRGTLIDGREFDSSYKRGEPAKFGVTQVIKGWTEALQLMTEGSKWMLYIPWQLAYGEKGSGKMIGPNETLVFEVELIAVMP
ncbi:MAG: FKBP-type peptidyl-prolyl cis-trans isomerase [Chthoniobacteraceae bacterium]